jgi:AcrR family transcriptional regulator
MENKDQFRTQIISKAAEVFTRFGFKKTTMDDIAFEVGKGKSSIYYYFKSKAEIFEAVCEFEAEILRQEVLKAVDAKSSSLEQIRCYVLTRMKAYKKVNNLYRVLSNGLKVKLLFVDELRERYEKQEVAFLKRILDQGIELGELQIQETDLTAIALVTVLKAIEIPLFGDYDEQTLESRLDHLLKVLFNGILRR